ncbi:mitotic checkpoint serine/threonine-protein kinase BUB1 isoform X1 [Nothobranchius furzeri]|uniref:Transcript variant X1 n=2 Tax=Nothobranchius furzeri TaxID=105023 RepID=A0A9D2Z349_NOTFU|nr:transcript variant X1 [Nothobranchius furzeri]
MDVASSFQRFKDGLSSYEGDDLLDPWDRFVASLEQSGSSGSKMSLVYDSLVQTFLNVDRYANDVRYINYCIKCASFYPDPMEVYRQLFSKGIGTRTAALYLAWAQQLEQRGMIVQADAVYQRAMENQAQPPNAVLHEYRQFESRTRTQQQALAGSRTPSQSFQSNNQMSSDPVTHSKDLDARPPMPANRTITFVSRSEFPVPSGPRPPTVSEYMKEVLVSEGSDSELCFEEVRAEWHFCKLRERQDREKREIMERDLKEREDKIQRVKIQLEELRQGLEACASFRHQTSSQQLPAARTDPDPPQMVFTRPPPSNHLSSRRSLGLRLHAYQTSVPHPPHLHSVGPSSEESQSPFELPDVGEEPELVVQSSMLPESVNPDILRAAHLHLGAPVQLCSSDSGPAGPSSTRLDGGSVPEPEEKLDVSQGGGANVSHVTPNTSLGFVQATPSRVLPSPTVHTREALGVIMDMFQAPPFLEESASSSARPDPGAGTSRSDCSLPHPPSSTDPPFTIFQDDDKVDNKNCSAAAPADRAKPIRTLADSAPRASKPNDTPSDLILDESTMWGARYNPVHSLAACPNSTTDFAMLAPLVSTPFTYKTPLCTSLSQNQDTAADADDDAVMRRQTKKLSPIMEQSPSDDQGSGGGPSQLLPLSVRQDTMVGDGLASVTTVLPPSPAVLSFRDQTDSSRSAGPGWEVYTSPEQPPQPTSLSSVTSKRDKFKILEDSNQPAGLEPVQNLVCDVPMSPESAPKPDWFRVRSPEAPTEPDLDVFLSPHRPRRAKEEVLDVPMSPEPLQLGADVPMSPQLIGYSDEPMMSPDRGTSSESQLVPNPWDDKLICDLLSSLTPPLSAHPRCSSWECPVPVIVPKTSISVGTASLRVDSVLGEGAFATVYQATDPVTSEKMILKVQKPANPWEFYINTCLDARLQPAHRHLFSSIHSAHLFRNGSVLLGELHNLGTLLNMVNIYRTLSERVVPQPLVLYFAVCILHTVEQLHAVHVVHADIKPDNFMLSQRFLENECFDPESTDHGLVLIDLGQSIDLQMFPDGTAFTATCLTSGFQCTEMLSGKPWSYQTDYFGIAGTVFCLLFGTYMQVSNQDGVWRTNANFRRNPHAELWLEFFHTLLNIPDCRSLPSLRMLRGKLTDVLQKNYSSKLLSLKRRLVVLLLESLKASRR